MKVKFNLSRSKRPGYEEGFCVIVKMKGVPRIGESVQIEDGIHLIQGVMWTPLEDYAAYVVLR